MTTTPVLALPTTQHPLSSMVPPIDPTDLADCCHAARPFVAVLVGLETTTPLLLCMHHARKHWPTLAPRLFTYRLLETP